MLSSPFYVRMLQTASIAKFIAAYTINMVASFILFNPHFAFGTLFEFKYRSGHSPKFTVSCWNCIIDLFCLTFDPILLTSHAFMPFNTTSKTIFLMTKSTFEFDISFLEEERVWASRCWAPWTIFMGIYISIDSSFLVFLNIILR